MTFYYPRRIGWEATSSDEDKVYVKIVALDEIYNFIVKNVLN
jgi:hypothetical protein